MRTKPIPIREIDASFINCGHCGNYSEMKTIGSGSDMVTVDSEDDRMLSWEEGTMYDILKCPACGKINFAEYHWSSYMDGEDFMGYSVLYPSNVKLPLGLPVKILKEYEAAEKIKSISPSAYALLLGRILEMICKDRDAKGKTFSDKLRDLKEKGEIPDILVKVASGLRGFRNIGAHAGLEEISEKEIPLIKSLCNALLEFIYTAPHLAYLAEQKLNSLKSK